MAHKTPTAKELEQRILKDLQSFDKKITGFKAGKRVVKQKPINKEEE